MNEETKVEHGYDASDIQVLEGLEAVRKRPGMYIGSTGPSGLHHLVYEIVDNAIDEALAGYCSEIKVSILPDNIIEVEDNGRGIPTGIHPKEGISAATVVYTILHAGGKFGGGGYKVSGGLHGVGASVVNALSEWLEITVYDGKNVHFQHFDRGGYTEPLKIIGTAEKTGTTVKFKADGQIFHDVNYDYNILIDRLREQAFLNGGIKIELTDLRDENDVKSEVLKYDGGIVEYVDWLQEKRGAERLHPDVIYIKDTVDQIMVEAAFQYNTDFNSEAFRSFANNIHTVDGGTHELAFKRALNKVVNDFVKAFKEKENEKKKKSRSKKDDDKKDEFVAISGEAIREAINAVISVKLPECEFEGQTKGKLGNPEVGPAVYKVVSEKLTYYFEEHPDTAQAIVIKAINGQAARDAAKRAMEAKRKSVADGAGLPGKLADCYDKDIEKTEIYIVEGDSAGGSAKQGRNSRYQAILPLWGKMLNVEKARVDRVYNNDKLTPVVKALGTGLGDEFDISKLRYGRVVIMADADVDGAHIRTLLLTFFFRFMRPLVEEGHVYLAQPPLFKVFRGKQVRYAFSDEERDDYIKELQGDSNGKVDVQRYKGLGEMDPEQLWETTMNPDTRTMLQVTLDDAAKADLTFSILMGDKVEPRREFIETNARYVEDLDI
ncbi:MAG: DNA topoisomerase (ATP-hydrolyzing) subunit B [Firmicutes bacterium]|nr:DNA topoisomerase (ATP-hydrolyzing) subunit B [[Eubacterium] siraeum]MCM1487330.1 DNA topoisomerase (ATP-hydrolyzing) subunit B [Bacillota bacterium]